MADTKITPSNYWTSITVSLTQTQWENLKELAEYRNMSPEECIRSFCQLGPPKVRWEHPAKAAHPK